MKTRVERTIDLFAKMKSNTENALWYRNCIVEENLRLVAHVIKEFKPYTDDQYQAGCIGLIVSVDTFNEDRGVPFPNYACFCIRREIHKMFRTNNKLIENILSNRMVFLDESVLMKNGDALSWSDIIPDEGAVEQFQALLDENELDEFFHNVVIPSIDKITVATKGQNTKVDLEKWKELEIRYILSLAEIESQKVRFNFTQMAKLLGISIQNVRNRHTRVIEDIKQYCRERGYNVD
jgi:RNA polymerase sigma factor (sigma-70 family)